MQEEAHDIIIPLHYLALQHLPLRHNSLEYEYNGFLRKYVWQFVDVYNYQFAKSQHIRFCLESSQNCIFEGELWSEKDNLFRTFKIDKAFLQGTTDFVEWAQLAKLKNLAKLEQLSFDFYDKWLSTPTEAFFTHFQQLKEVNIKCHCTGGFNNFINPNEIEKSFKNGIPHVNVVIDITGDFYY